MFAKCWWNWPQVVDHKQESGESNEAVVDNDKQEVGNEKFSRAIHRFSQNMLVEVRKTLYLCILSVFIGSEFGY